MKSHSLKEKQRVQGTEEMEGEKDIHESAV